MLALAWKSGPSRARVSVQVSLGFSPWGLLVALTSRSGQTGVNPETFGDFPQSLIPRPQKRGCINKD